MSEDYSSDISQFNIFNCLCQGVNRPIFRKGFPFPCDRSYQHSLLLLPLLRHLLCFLRRSKPCLLCFQWNCCLNCCCRQSRRCHSGDTESDQGAVYRKNRAIISADTLHHRSTEFSYRHNTGKVIIGNGYIGNFPGNNGTVLNCNAYFFCFTFGIDLFGFCRNILCVFLNSCYGFHYTILSTQSCCHAMSVNLFSIFT